MIRVENKITVTGTAFQLPFGSLDSGSIDTGIHIIYFYQSPLCLLFIFKITLGWGGGRGVWVCVCVCVCVN